MGQKKVCIQSTISYSDTKKRINNEILVFNFRAVISQSRQSFYYPLLKDKSDKYLNKVGKPGKTLIWEIFKDVPGITIICINPYELELVLARAYKKKEVIEGAKKVIAKIMKYSLEDFEELKEEKKEETSKDKDQKKQRV